jgi:tight adherence protein C
VTAAGLDGRGGVAIIAHSRVALAEVGLCCGGVWLVVHPIGAVLAGVCGVVGYVGPARWVQARALRRRRQVVRELPDLIDLVVICTTSGMALEPSLRLAAERLPGVLATEMGYTLRELDLGTPRREAYVALSQRLSVPELTGLIGSLLQADELGAPIASVLTRQGELLRAARTQDIREHAARAAPKVQLVVAMVMVPAALLVVLGVLVIQLIGQIGIVGGAT